MTKRVIKQVVTEQIINMLDNNILNENGGESLRGWLEDGEVFRINGYSEEEIAELMEFVDEISPLIDNLSFKLDVNICE